MGWPRAADGASPAFLLGWLGLYVAITGLGLPPYNIRQIVVTGLVIAAGGFLVGPAIMGTYLFISMNWFGRHAGEFSRCDARLQELAAPARGDHGRSAHPRDGIDVVPRRWKETTPTADSAVAARAGRCEGDGAEAGGLRRGERGAMSRRPPIRRASPRSLRLPRVATLFFALASQRSSPASPLRVTK